MCYVIGEIRHRRVSFQPDALRHWGAKPPIDMSVGHITAGDAGLKGICLHFCES